ncbi:MAG: hypothetical protein FWE36_04255 [Erysipelotrichales bacterium]|nr:hypothetical protein [Erysipelotrichales bacterium]
MKNNLTNLFARTGRLMQFIIRRERVSSSIWIFGLLIFTISVALALPGMFPLLEERIIMRETMQSPAMVAILGPVFGNELSYSVGVMFANQMLLFTLLAVAIMNIFFVVKHTRTDEEQGRSEVIRSLPVGRLSTLSATLLVALLINFILAVFTGFGLALVSFEEATFGGAMMYGFVIGVTGFFFACATAVFSQFSSNSRGANIFSIIFLFLLFGIRAIGDVAENFLSFISPLGLVLQTQVYVNNYIWPLIIVFFLSIFLVVLACFLNLIRDLGQGLIAAKPGKAAASKMLLSPMGLAIRLLKVLLIAWLIGMFYFGLMYGAVMDFMADFIENNDFFQQILPPSDEHEPVVMFLSMLMLIMSLMGAVPALMAILKLRTEEKSGRLEQLLAKPVGRTKLLTSYLLIAFVTSFLVLFMSAFGLWGASALMMEEVPFSLGLSLQIIFVFLPAIWLMLGLAVFLIGFAPKLVNLIYLYLGFSLFVVYLGGVLNLPSWMRKLSPYGYIPQLPADDVRIHVLIIISVIAMILAVSGWFGYKRRDMKMQ